MKQAKRIDTVAVRRYLEFKDFLNAASAAARRRERMGRKNA